MANISSASGKIILKGDWTKEAIDAFKPVLDLWSFHGYYGISDLSEELNEDHLSVGFWGNGRWSFSGTLELFEIWARGWVDKQPKNPNGEPEKDITEEQYDRFLEIMHEKKLIVEFDFEDEEESSSEKGLYCT